METGHLTAAKMEGQDDRGTIAERGTWTWVDLCRKCIRRTAMAIVMVSAILLGARVFSTATLSEQQQESPTAFHDSRFELHHPGVTALRGRYGRVLEDGSDTVDVAQEDYSPSPKRRWLDEPFLAGSADGEKATTLEGGAVQYLISTMDQPPLSSYPSVEESTVLFLHVFKVRYRSSCLVYRAFFFRVPFHQRLTLTLTSR